MKRALALALLLWPAVALGYDKWQDQQNTGGFCPAPTMSISDVMLEQSDGTIVCDSQVPCSTVPVDNASLECSGGFLVVNTVPSTNVVCGANDLAWFNGSSQLTCGPAETVAISANPSGTPATGFGTCWFDSSILNWTCKNSLGTITHGVQTNTGATNNFVTSIAATGAVGLAQPAYSGISGTVPCAGYSLTAPGLTCSGGVLAATPARQLAFFAENIVPGGWLATSISTSTFNTAVEYVFRQAFTTCRITANITQNNTSGGTFTAATYQLSKNGSPVGGSCAVVIPAGTTGVFDSGMVSQAVATNDLIGLEAIDSGGPPPFGSIWGQFVVELQ